MNRWYRVALFNLVILAFLGVVLRYKINFPLEFIEQKKLLHAHSHFAFSGWVGFLLQLLVLLHFTNLYERATTFWNRFFVASLIVNYSMIVSFALHGYSVFSIILSTSSLFLSYIFCFKVYYAVRGGLHLNSVRFLVAALFFVLLSSLGPYALAFIIATKTSDQYLNHNALYYFLHFQYNGWFTFAILAFLFRKLESSKYYDKRTANIVFVLLAATCIPGYLLTTLWKSMPVAIIAINALTALLQLVAIWYLVKLLQRNVKSGYLGLPGICKWLYSLAIAAFILKTLLQCFSAHPQLGQLAFAYRPIIIGYLHLIFLVFVSIYMLGILAETQVLQLNSKLTRTGLIVFSATVIINEILLAVQGVMSISYIYLSSVNEMLFYNTVLILLGAILLFAAVLKKPLSPAATNNPVLDSGPKNLTNGH